MKSRYLSHITFWIAVTVFLIAYYGRKGEDYIQAFYFVSFLVPIALGTTYFFNYYLVPAYLLKKRYFKFILYFIYALIFSLYFEMLVIGFSFIVLVKYQYEKLNQLSIDPFSLGTTLYLIVFLVAFARMVRSYQKMITEKDRLAGQIEKNQRKTITVTSDRKQVPINLSEILFVESLADYVKVITVTDTIITREKISKLEKELPDTFRRIHRSFLVNLHHVKSFNNEKIYIDKHELPISRSYRKKVTEILSK